ncbi:carbohydrate binding domain-containing protein [Coraliomargarita algicola]|uniref:Carbohydrate binding domain-containing protein n=1 Tax=Coraliomargarita algicola TaxID=3092156 RepID=A0ABZ0RLG3_9BACT|nr:carbohydrate binding domain-containing protein [Coraliomargarita sp. J2-16]WPJ96288.1 carbohydrate binding domain-containing protein [Coraliomargarita sp. J2-16]
MKFHSCLLSLAIFIQAATAATSSLTTRHTDGYLAYSADSYGNSLPDYSYAGYKLGTVPIPNVIPIKATVSPIAGDDTANIQNAIDTVEAMPLDSDGFRGVVLLEPGTYDITSKLSINQSGVVIRGSGAGKDGTIFFHQGTTQSTTISIGPLAGGIGSSYLTDITDSYVPVGENFVTVADSSALSVGQTIFIYAEHTQDWIDELGLDSYWNPEDFTLKWERIVLSIDTITNSIGLDSPLTSIVDNGNGFATAKVRVIGSDARLSNIGIENIMFVSDYNRDVKQDDDDYYNHEDHANIAIRFSQAKDCWVQRCIGFFYRFSFVYTWTNCNRITVQDCAMLDGVSRDTPTHHSGGREYYFCMDGSNMLVQRCFTRGARHAYSTNGPKSNNTFLHSYSKNGHLSSEPHQRWSSGILFDNVYSDSMFKLHGLLGSHGQSSANNALWNCVSENKRWWEPEIWLNSPPSDLGTNWVVGTIINGVHSDPAIKNYYGYGSPGFVESTDVPVYPRSLYMAQARDRIGDEALYATSTNEQFLSRDAVYQTLLDTYASIPEFGDPASISSWAPSTPSYKLTVADQGYIELLDESFTIAEWSNATEVSSPTQAGTFAAQWAGANLDAYNNFKLTEPPSDWSGYDTLSFWMYSDVANDAKFAIVIPSENPATTGGDYYHKLVTVDWTGWKKFEFPLNYPEFSKARSPLGWYKIDSVLFANKGYGAVIKSNTVLYIDQLRLTQSTQLELLNENDTITNWSNSEAVLAYSVIGNVAAKWQNAHLDAYNFFKLSTLPTNDWSSFNTLSFWMYSEVANNARVVIIVPSENTASTGSDYYNTRIDIDWTGWKHFIVPLSYPEFSAARSPIGWHQIDSFSFANKGYGAIVKPDTVLYIDQVELLDL